MTYDDISLRPVVTYNLTYDAENRLSGVSGAATATFVYDGDGKRVKATAGGVTTAYVGNYFEWTGSTSTMVKYYYAGITRVAMRVGSNNPKWLLSDHLGSQSIVASYDGLTEEGELRYKAWGESRYSSGTTPTKRQYTGQISDSYINLYWYNSRWYDPALSRWIQPDVIIPEGQGVQAWDRYAYANNSPVVYNDPSGHCAICVFGYIVYQGISTIYNSQTEATHQALGLVGNWFFEVGGETQRFGPENALTQEVMHDPGMDQFQENWEESGYSVPFSWEHRADERSSGSRPERLLKGASVFLREHVFELGLSVLGFGSQNPEGPIDPVGGTIGSLDRITVSAAENGQVQFEVYNEMGWASGTRIPGTSQSIIQNRDRSAWGPGGTTYQYFYWYEEKPNK